MTKTWDQLPKEAQDDHNRIEREIEQVIKLMKKDFPKMDDYNVTEKGVVQILKGEKVINQITESKLSDYWAKI